MSSLAPIVERELEFAVLDACLASAERGGGGLVMVEGVAGIGKTRLLERMAAVAPERGFRVLAARGGELERTFAFGVARQLFEPLLALESADGRDALFAGAARLCEPLFGAQAVGPVGTGDSALRQMHGMYWLCANLSGRRPLLLVIDDLQWSDVASLRFLAFVVRRLAGMPLAVVVAVRPGERTADQGTLDRLAGEPGVTVLRPAALSRAGIATLVQERFGCVPAPEFVARCQAATGGIPFLLWQLLSALVTDGRRPSVAEARRIAEVGPATVARWVADTLSRLPASAARLCKALAILGGEAELRRCAALFQGDMATALADLDSLRDVGLLKLGESVAFVHPIVHAAVYASLPVADRERGHLAAARMLDAEGRPPREMAAHLERLQPRGEAWIVRTLLAAAADAAACGALDVVITLLGRALREPPPVELRAEVLLMLGIAEARSSQAGAIEHLSAALDDVKDLYSRAAGVVELLLALAIADRMREGLAYIEDVIALATPVNRELALELESILAASTRLIDGQAAPAPRWRRYLPLEGATPGERLLLGEVAWERMIGGGTAEEVGALAGRAITDGAEQILGQSGAQPPFFQACVVLMFAEQFERAEQALVDAMAVARTSGSMWMTATAENWLAHVALRRGRVAEAAAHAATAVDLCAIVGWSDALASMRAVLAVALVEKGDLADAADALDFSTPANRLPPAITWSLALEGRAALRLEQGRPAEALADLRALAGRERGGRAENPAALPWRSQAALALYALGEQREAETLALEEVRRARQFGAARALGISLRVAGLVGREHGTERLRESVRTLRGSGAPVEHARALIDLGAAVRRAGRRSEARDPLREGLEIADACGATALADRGHTELLATGARPRRRSFSGVNSLTPSERRIAAMAADGMGNVAIAQALFVSRKTVETHLGHVYEKLAIASRTQLSVHRHSLIPH